MDEQNASSFTVDDDSAKNRRSGLFRFLSSTRRRRADTEPGVCPDQKCSSAIFPPGHASITNLGSTVARMASKASLKSRKRSHAAARDDAFESGEWSDHLFQVPTWEDDHSVITPSSHANTTPGDEFVMRPSILPDASPPTSILFPYDMYGGNGELPRATVEEIGKNHVDVPAPLHIKIPKRPSLSRTNALSPMSLAAGHEMSDGYALASSQAVMAAQRRNNAGSANITSDTRARRSSTQSPLSSLSPKSIAFESFLPKPENVPDDTHPPPVIYQHEPHLADGNLRSVPFAIHPGLVRPRNSIQAENQTTETTKGQPNKNDSYVQTTDSDASSEDESSSGLDSSSDSDHDRPLATAIRQLSITTRTSQPGSARNSISHSARNSVSLAHPARTLIGRPTFRSRGESIGLPDCSEHAHVKAASYEKRLSRAMGRSVRKSRAELLASGRAGEQFRICDYMSTLLSEDVGKRRGKGKGRNRGETI